MPADADAYNGRGTAHARLGDHRAAVADAREASDVGKSRPRVIYNAAGSTRSRPRSPLPRSAAKGRAARQLSSQYQDTAVQLIREAFEREPPEKRRRSGETTIQPDPALKAIRRRLKFDELIATNKKPSS